MKKTRSDLTVLRPEVQVSQWPVHAYVQYQVCDTYESEYGGVAQRVQLRKKREGSDGVRVVTNPGR